MTGSQAVAILPLIVLASGAIVLMLQIAVRRHHGIACGVTLATAAIAFLAVFAAAHVAPLDVTPLLHVDGFALFFTALICAIAVAVAALSYGYLRQQQIAAEELYLLLLVATLGATVLVASSHFASFLIGLEILSASLFALVAYPLARPEPLEAAIKYLVLAGVSSAFLAFGMALVYAATGSMDFAAVGRAGSGAGLLSLNVPLIAGAFMILAGIGFKLSLVPFHMWAPDVYEGAPAPVAGFLATASKAAVLVLLLRYFAESESFRLVPVWLVLAGFAVASMLAGNLLALLQDNVKRMLAYSSIAHLGYLLVPLLAGGEIGAEAVAFYLIAYTVTSLGAFGVVSLVSEQPGIGRDADRIDDYRGLFWRRPWLAGALAAMLLSLAGIPLTAGFLAKFYALAAGVASGLWLLVAVLVAGSAIGLFYYLRLIIVLFARDGAPLTSPAPAPAGRVVLVVLAGLLIWWGVYPSVFIALARDAAAGL